MSESDRPLHLGICLPSMGTHLTETALSLTAMAIVNEHHNVYQSIFNQQQASVACCRNLIARDAVEAGTDYTLWLDADMAFNPDIAMRLLKHEKDIVGATYPQRMPPYVTNGRFWDGFGPGLTRAEFMPFGAMLVKTDVFRKLPEPWFYESYKFDGTVVEQLSRAFECAANITLTSAFIREVKCLIERHYPVTGTGAGRPTAIRGEDANFCREARQHGYTVWCDTDLSRQMLHIGKQCVSLGAALPGMPGEIIDPELSTNKN